MEKKEFKCGAIQEARKVVEALIANNSELVKLERQPENCCFSYFKIDESVFGEEVKIIIFDEGTYNIELKRFATPSNIEDFNSFYLVRTNGVEKKVAELDAAIEQLKETKKRLEAMHKEIFEGE